MDVFEGDDEVVFLAVADQVSTVKSQIEAWIATYGWELPVGLDSPGQAIFARYGETRDAFLVFNQEQKLHYKRTGVGNNSAATTFPKVIDAVNELKETAVERGTWGRIKRLHGD